MSAGTDLRTQPPAAATPPAATAVVGPAPARGPRPSWQPSLVAAIAVALATLSLSPLLDGGWLGRPLLMLVAVSGTGALLAQTRAPLFLVPLAQTAVGIATLLWLFVPTAPWGFLPSPAALATLRLTLQDGLTAVEQYAPPAPLSPGLVALVVLGVGVCAMVTHVLSVCLRLPVATIVPLAALYAVPAATLPGGSPWWAFALVAAGWLAILLTDSRREVGSWGLLVPRSANSPARLRSSLWTGPALRIAVIGAALALAIPPLVPGLTDGFLGGSGSGGGGDAEQALDANAISIDPFVSLRRDLLTNRDLEVMSYTTNGDNPNYLRLVIADSFDGETWLPRTFSADVAPTLSDTLVVPPGLSRDVARTPTEYRFSSSRLASQYLPMPYPVSAVTIAGDWHWDAATSVAFSTTTSTQATDWEATALNLEPTPAQLRAFTVPVADVRERLGNQLDSLLPPAIIEEAKRVTAGLPTPYDQALALQWWFRDKFAYSTNVRGDPSVDQLTAFLEDRVGYCQQFAATMALMARALNIQARVAVGFTPGTDDGSGNYRVSTQDAHAWPELYFGAAGWVRFEPTPRANADGGEVSVPAYGRQENLRQQDPQQNTEQPLAEPIAPDEADAAGTEADGEPIGDRVRRASVVTLLAVLLVAAATPALIRRRRRSRRLSTTGAALAEGGWAELRDTLRDLGRSWSDADTPRQAAARLHRAGLDDDGSVTRLARATERARYARDAGSGADTVVEDVAAVRQLLIDRSDRTTRLRAAVLPPSVLDRDE